MRVRMPNIPERQSEHEIQINFEVARLTGEASIAQPPFPAGVFVRRSFNNKSFSGKHRLGSLLDFGAIRQHFLTIERLHVIEIDIYRQPGHVQHEEVHGRAAFQCQFPLEIRMRTQSV